VYILTAAKLKFNLRMSFIRVAAGSSAVMKNACFGRLEGMHLRSVSKLKQVTFLGF
jgi:hypothetical protein